MKRLDTLTLVFSLGLMLVLTTFVVKVNAGIFNWRANQSACESGQCEAPPQIAAVVTTRAVTRTRTTWVADNDPVGYSNDPMGGFQYANDPMGSVEVVSFKGPLQTIAKAPAVIVRVPAAAVRVTSSVLAEKPVRSRLRRAAGVVLRPRAARSCG